MVFVRTDWNSLNSTQRGNYARAVQAMKDISRNNPGDPRGWQYQANVHGMSGAVPPAQKKFLAMCQHQSYFFLSWHRMYIYYFERILRAVGPDKNLALPYWNYTDTPGVASTRALPQEFRQPNNSTNPLFVQQRNPAINAGGSMPASDVRYDIAYSFSDFYTDTTRNGLALSFGGVAAGPHHFGNYNGQVENQPHNLVHVQVGGWMGNPNTAAADPIFWMHHCNIDRLWEGWLSLGGGRANPKPGTPPSDKWLKDVFFFHDGDGSEVQLTGAQVVNTAQQLDYRYDKLPPKPLSRKRTIPSLFRSLGIPGLGVAPPVADRKAVTVGESQEKGIRLDDTRTVDLSLNANRLKPPPQSGELGVEKTEPEQRVILTLDGVKVEGLPQHTYEVYLNLPSPAEAHHNSIYYVGNIGIFTHPTDDADADGGANPPHGQPGHVHSEHEGHDHGHGGGGHEGHEGHGDTNLAFDVTDVVHDLQAQGKWNPSDAKLTFVASTVEPPPSEGVGAAPAPAATPGEHFTIDKISLAAL